MYADVSWPVQRNQPTFVVPSTAIASTTQRTFIIRVRDGMTEWVDIKRGNSLGDQVEIFGPLQEGNKIVVRATDELRPGVKVSLKTYSKEIKSP